MNISRITYLSELMTYRVADNDIKIVKSPEYRKVTKMEQKDNNMNRHRDKTPQELYEMYHSIGHKEIKQVDIENIRHK